MQTGRFLDPGAAVLPENAVLTDDPFRERMMAAHYLDNARLASEQRGMTAHIGAYNGIPVSVISLGFGQVSLLGWLREAAENGARRFVYVGECVSPGPPQSWARLFWRRRRTGRGAWCPHPGR